MNLRFFADHCVPNSAVHALQNAGYEVLRLKDHMPADSKDPAVIAKAVETDAVLFSLNGDFADIVTYPPADYRGIIALQVHNHPQILPQLMTRLLGYLSAHPQAEHYVGKLLVVEVHRIRIRQ